MPSHIGIRTGTRWALSLAGFLAATAAFRPAAPAVHHPARRETAVLKVENDGFTDRIIYVVTESGMRQRLGTATAATTTTLTIPPVFLHGASYVWFAARRFAGFGYEWSPQTYLSPGDTVRMMIQSGVGALELASVSGGG